MDKNSLIFIAGANGMVGSAIKNRLIADGYSNLLTPSSKELNLKNQAQTEKFFSKNKPEYVFFAAAKVGGILANNTYKAEFIYDNITIAANIIHYSYKSGVKKLLNLGSSCIYPREAKQPMKETALLSDYLEQTNEPYAIAKIAAIKMCTSYNYQYNTNFISLMPTNLFGMNDTYNLEVSHLIPAIIRKIILGKALMDKNFDFIANDFKRHQIGFNLDGKIKLTEKISLVGALNSLGVFAGSIEFWGTGAVLREFMFVDDLADACLYFMQNISAKETGDFVNIGTANEISIKDTINMIVKIVGYEGKIEFDSLRPDGTLRKLMDSSKARALGWQPQYDFESSLKAVIEHYIADVKA